jgi:hypothetical protein
MTEKSENRGGERPKNWKGAGRKPSNVETKILFKRVPAIAYDDLIKLIELFLKNYKK